MNDNLARLERIFREVLDDPGINLTPSFSMAGHPGWDSVAAVQIVLAAEQEFSCRLPTEAVAGITNVSDILRHLPAPSAREAHAEGGTGTPEDGPARVRAEALLSRIRQVRDHAPISEVLADLRLAARLQRDYNFLSQAARILEGLAATGAVPAKATPVKIALLSSSTTEFVIPLLKLACFRDGLWAQVYAPPFGSYRQEVLDPGSALYAFAPDVAIVAVSWRDSHLAEFSEDPEETVARAVADMAGLARMLSERARCTVILHNFDLPALDSTGHLGAADRRGRTRLLRSVNARLADDAPAGCIVLDFDRVSSQFGKEAWESAELWHLAKQHPSTGALPLLVDHYVALIRARLGFARKVLVFDLDNTLWRGVIGEDGLGGIRVGPPSPEGEAHAALQRYALELKHRGVLLAVCSKNNDADARLPFRSHEGMILKEDDFVAFSANWDDKPSNLRKMAQRLNLGLDSFVFVDDNPVERERVRGELPEVAVVEPGPDAFGFVPALNRGLYFEALALSQEDASRHEGYRANNLREEMKEGAASVDDFLRKLEMKVYRGAFSEHVLDRVVQLLGRTNQFNLTTRRHSAEAVREMMCDRRVWTRHFRLVDRFGDNGIVGLVIARESGPAEWEIDTFLLSCRVVGRRLEDHMVSTVLGAARAAGCERVRGLYFPTAKNPMVADFYTRMGFREDPSRDEAGARAYLRGLNAEAFPDAAFFAIEEV